MDTEFDYDLTPNQWETLKALRKPARSRQRQSAVIWKALLRSNS